MGYSAAAMAGIKDNGREWKATIRGLGDINEKIRESLETVTSETAEEVSGYLKEIAALFRPYFDKSDQLMEEGYKWVATMGELEDLEWFEDESPAYEIENEALHEWRKEFDHRLESLYDFADYNRIWVKPAGWKQ